jgi:hypothetical protein
MRSYRNLLPLLIHTEEGSYKQGEVFEKEFTPEEELENVNSGLLEIVPQTYRVVAEDSIVYDTPTGGTFEAAMLIENESALIEGGHIERVDEPAKETPRAKPARKKKEAKG